MSQRSSLADHALPSGVMAEQVHPYTGAPLSVSPLTWSHATLAATVREYLAKRSKLVHCPTCGQPLHWAGVLPDYQRHRYADPGPVQ